MTDIEISIHEALRALEIEERKLSDDDARAVTTTAMLRYVDGNPRAWGEGLKVPSSRESSLARSLSSILPDTDGEVFFLPETGQSDLPVFRMRATEAERVICECYFFEYYLLALDFSWLVAESDHNEFFVCRRRAG